MITFLEQNEPTWLIREFRKATKLVNILPGEINFEWIHCHEITRAVSAIMTNWNVVDGHFGAAEHSWLEHNTLPGYKLDIYAVGSLPPVQLVCSWTGRQWKPSENYRSDIRWWIVIGLTMILTQRGN